MKFIKKNEEYMTEKEFEEFGKLQLEMAEDSKNSDTYKFFKMALHNMEVLKNIRKDINALERTGEDEYVQILQVNDILDFHLDQSWLEKPKADIPMCETNTPGFAENKTGRVTLWHCSLYDELVADLSLRDKDGRYDGSIAASIQTNIPKNIKVKEADEMAKYALKAFCKYKENTPGTADKLFIKKCLMEAMAKTEEHFHMFDLDKNKEKDI